MKDFNAKKKIENVDDFNDYATDILEAYLDKFTYEDGLIRDVTEDDGVGDNFSYMYTDKGLRLAEKMRRLLYKIGHAHYPNEDINIETHMLIEE